MVVASRNGVGFRFYSCLVHGDLDHVLHGDLDYVLHWVLRNSF
jgi:hypothetical protein